MTATQDVRSTHPMDAQRTRRGRVWIVVCLAAVLVLSLLPPSEDPASVLGVRTPDSTLDVVAAASPAVLSAQVSRRHFPTARRVVVARSDDYADALSAVPLAASRAAPILLTPSSSLHDAVRKEVLRLRPSTAIVIGGPNAITPKVVQALRDAGVERISRIAGRNRFETAATIRGHLDPGPVFIANGGDDTKGWPDALSASPLAASSGAAILLVERDRIPSETVRSLRNAASSSVTIVGGTGVVSRAVASRVKAASGVTAHRLAGRNRFETSSRVADQVVRAQSSQEHVWLATGGTWATGLVAGGAASHHGGPLLLVDDAGLQRTPTVEAWLRGWGDEGGTVHLVSLNGVPALTNDIQSLLTEISPALPPEPMPEQSAPPGPTPTPTVSPPPESSAPSPTVPGTPAPSASPSPVPWPAPSASPSPVPSSPTDASDPQPEVAVVGFGRGARGGEGGPVVTVTSTGDDGPGSLREAVAAPGPRVVNFDVSGTIELSRPVQVAADITVDGRGSEVTIAGAGLHLHGVHNVVIRDLSFDHGIAGANADMINIGKASRDIWLDHLDLTGAADELVSIWGGSTDITVSWSRFHDADKALLVGTRAGDDVDRGTRVTVHHNVFERMHQRSPRVTWGRVHAFNNLVTYWTGNAMSAVRDGHLLSENNIFVPGPDLRAIRHEGVQRVDVPGLVHATGDWLKDGATVALRLPDQVFAPDYPYTPHPADHDLQTLLLTTAGHRTGGR